MSESILHEELLEALLQYGQGASGLYVGLSDILDHLHITYHAPDLDIDDPNEVARHFVAYLAGFTGVAECLRSVYFAVISIDDYLSAFLQNYGFHIIAVHYMKKRPDFEDIMVKFNSASPDQILSSDYYDNLVRCRALWLDVSTELRDKMMRAVFPWMMMIGKLG